MLNHLSSLPIHRVVLRIATLMAAGLSTPSLPYLDVLHCKKKEAPCACLAVGC